MDGEISFGTEGWRGIIGKDFTHRNVGIVAQAYADFLNQKLEPGATVVVGFDTRFMSKENADVFAKVLAANAINVFLCKTPVGTPVLSFAVRHLSADGGVMITASHNPPQYNGIKFKGSYGGPATEETVKEIATNLYRSSVQNIPLPGRMAYYSPDTAYLEALNELIDARKIKKARLKLVIDAMYGSGSGYLANFLASHGIEHKLIRGEANPSFCGINPEPIAQNLKMLIDAVRENKADVGLATDGDGDRIGAVDKDGSFINAQQIFALILKYCFLKQVIHSGVGKTFSTTWMVDKIASAKGCKVYETPVGFKHLTKLFLTKEIAIAGEESGGIGLKVHIPERDGILNALLLLEYMAESGKTLKGLVQDIFKEIGPHYYGRVDLPLQGAETQTMMRSLLEYGFPWHASQLTLKTLDGVKWLWPDKAWILFRGSGTEPVVRIYAEGESPEIVNNLLSQGKKITQELDS